MIFQVAFDPCARERPSLGFGLVFSSKKAIFLNLPETNSSDLKMVVSNRNPFFQRFIFRGYVSFREGTSNLFEIDSIFFQSCSEICFALNIQLFLNSILLISFPKPKKTYFLSPIIMDMEHGRIWKGTSVGRGPFSFPWLWQGSSHYQPKQSIYCKGNLSNLPYVHVYSLISPKWVIFHDPRTGRKTKISTLPETNIAT